jgi:GH43 family beta-xylosidase
MGMSFYYRFLSRLLAVVLAVALPVPYVVADLTADLVAVDLVTAPEPKDLPFMVTNPVFPSPSQDPWVVHGNNQFHEVRSDGLRILVRSAERFRDLMKQPARMVWRAPSIGPNSQNVWAPEMHWLKGKWWIFYAADDGNNANHRVFVMESRTTDIADGFEDRGQWETEGWAIDPTVFIGKDGQLYALWSGWPGATDGQQNLYISRMSDPATLAGGRVVLASPTLAWERNSLPVCEGPQVLKRHGSTFVVYSASGSWTKDYCLGMLVHREGDYMDPNSWVKQADPVLTSTDAVWGVGHCAFLSSRETGDLIFYHAKTTQSHGWEDRNVRVQPFGWREDGLPKFGKPVNPGLPVAIIPGG